MTLKQAQAQDVHRIWGIILQAKQQMRKLNSTQWDDDYPLIETIQEDVAKDYGYILTSDRGDTLAYGAVIFDGEPAYEHIEGKWPNQKPYATLHRLAVADEAKHQGVAGIFIAEAEKLSAQRGILNFRVDTNFDNIYMQKALVKADFVYCGEVVYPRGRRLAYAKIIKNIITQKHAR